MRRYVFYKQVYDDYAKLCSEGRQDCSFIAYCHERGVEYRNLTGSLGKRFSNIKSLPGYKRIRSKSGISGLGQLCLKIYNEFKVVCAEGAQSGSFASYYQSFGITREQMRGFQKSNRLRVSGLPGFVKQRTPKQRTPKPRAQEVPFEDVIFEEAGFLPSAAASVITVKVGGSVAVSFPSDTDIAVIVDFIEKLGKEGRHVGA